MVILKPVTPVSFADFRDVRLRALADTPLAFGSTFANESKLTDADWQHRAAQWTSERSAACLAWDGDVPCGIVASFLDREDPSKAHLVSMWVAPTHRKLGVGRLLVNQMIDWAGSRGATAMILMVTSSNNNAIRFYESLRFARTGKTVPYPNDSSLIEFEMMRTITSPPPSPLIPATTA